MVVLDRGRHVLDGLVEVADWVAGFLPSVGVVLESGEVKVLDPGVHEYGMSWQEWVRERDGLLRSGRTCSI